jgi:hypothetical protein
LPQRWPLSTRYYQLLFNGELGFTPARGWKLYPQLNLLGWRIEFPDDYVEEALTVYDHPRVVLFRKTAAYHPQKVAQKLNIALLRKVQNKPLSHFIAAGSQVPQSTLPRLPHLK